MSRPPLSCCLHVSLCGAGVMAVRALPAGLLHGCMLGVGQERVMVAPGRRECFHAPFRCNHTEVLSHACPMNRLCSCDTIMQLRAGIVSP